MAAHSPIVLVHGALQTAATWDLVVPMLERAGRRVVIARLAGLEGVEGELTEQINLETHVRQVVELLAQQNLKDVVLVGHSYAGMIITGVAEHARERIAGLVYVDALVPEHGQSALDIVPDATANGFRALAAQAGGWRIEPNEHFLDLWGLHEGDARVFVAQRFAPFTLHCFSQALDAPTRAAHALNRWFIASVKPDYPVKTVFDPFAQRARDEGWSYHELPTGHDAQAEMPEALAALLLVA